MAKTKEELDALKEEINKVNEKICELTPEELEQVTGGINPPTMFDNSVPLKKALIAQTGKINELIKTIEASNNVIIYNSSEHK